MQPIATDLVSILLGTSKCIFWHPGLLSYEVAVTSHQSGQNSFFCCSISKAAYNRQWTPSCDSEDWHIHVQSNSSKYTTLCRYHQDFPLWMQNVSNIFKITPLKGQSSTNGWSDPLPTTASVQCAKILLFLHTCIQVLQYTMERRTKWVTVLVNETTAAN